MTIDVPVTREEKYALILERAHRIRIGDLYELVHGFSKDELMDQLKTLLDDSSEEELDTLIAEANGYPDEEKPHPSATESAALSNYLKDIE